MVLKTLIFAFLALSTVNCQSLNACDDVECPVQTMCVPDACEEGETCEGFSCVDGCIGIECSTGFQCDPMNGECIAVNCEAEKVCPIDFDCTPQENICFREPCPQFTCTPQNPCATIRCLPHFECNSLNGECVPTSCEADGACEEGFYCEPAEKLCVTAPCPQFNCVPENLCATVRCTPGFECDELNGECLPVSCDAEEACAEGFTCEPAERYCVRAPCPQFNCLSEEESGCLTDCGNPVSTFSLFDGDGEDYCKRCICLVNGATLCFPFYDCPSDPVEEQCDSGCLTTCGNSVPVGASFQDDGSNYCNTCGCQENGLVICTLIACEGLPGGDDCERFENTCETECGSLVDVGVQFQDDGSNACNSCICQGPGLKICTEALCGTETSECALTAPGFCSTNCGKLIGNGVNFQDDGENFCNECTCENGEKSCTEIACVEQPDETHSCE